MTNKDLNEAYKEHQRLEYELEAVKVELEEAIKEKNGFFRGLKDCQDVLEQTYLERDELKAFVEDFVKAKGTLVFFELESKAQELLKEEK